MDKGFLSKDISVQDLLLNCCDGHHVYPKHYLKREGKTIVSTNQIPNLLVAQSEINIAIGAKPPSQYFGELLAQTAGERNGMGISSIGMRCCNTVGWGALGLVVATP
jgi:hypothetical protein